MNEIIILLIDKWNDNFKTIYKDISSYKETIVLYTTKDRNGKLDMFSPILNNVRKLLKYDYIWVINSNLTYQVDWVTFFKRIGKYNSDLLLLNHESKTSMPNWKHWPDIDNNIYGYRICDDNPHKHINDIDLNLWRKGSLDLFRMTNKLLNILNKELLSYGQHPECVIPTLANINKLKVEDIEKIIENENCNFLVKTSNYSRNNINPPIQKIENILYEMEYYKSVDDHKSMDDVYKSFVNYVNKLFNETSENFIGSKDFCKLAKICSILDRDNDLKKNGLNFELFLTNKHISGLGDYVMFLVYYVNKYGAHDKIKNIIESLIMNQIYSLTPQHKKYIENELITFKKYNICNRILNRIFAQIQSQQDPYIKYEILDLSETSDISNLLNTGKINKLKCKYYPF